VRARGPILLPLPSEKGEGEGTQGGGKGKKKLPVLSDRPIKERKKGGSSPASGRGGGKGRGGREKERFAALLPFYHFSARPRGRGGGRHKGSLKGGEKGGKMKGEDDSTIAKFYFYFLVTWKRGGREKMQGDFKTKKEEGRKKRGERTIP